LDKAEENDSTYFNWQGILIRQQDDVHKVGTDAILLGAWVPHIIKSTSSILDVGCGTGVVALMLAKAFPDTTVHAIDFNNEAVHLSAYNVERSEYSSRIKVWNENILDKPKDDLLYELVVTNPPYHTEKVLSSDAHRRNARHLSVSIEEWITGMINRLRSGGNFCVVVPSDKAQEWIAAANQVQYFCKDRLDIYSFHQDTLPSRSLLHFHDSLTKPQIRKLVIYEEAKRYTPEYLQLTQIRPVP
jgi:tRNA1Val (adenine37-N6)-methyltransferase